MKNSANRILVVDDSVVERRMTQILLERAIPDAEILTALSGMDALNQLENERFNLVITDLQMPGLNGLQLVEEIKARYEIPVILMTSFGNEELAVEALSAGAASYVPKRLLNQQLISTVNHVLQLAESIQSRKSLLSCLDALENRFVLDSDVTLVSPLVGHLQDQLVLMHLFGETEILRITTAFYESLTNAIFHGNLAVSTDLRHRDKSAPYVMESQRDPQRHSNRKVFVTVQLSADEARFVVRDEGRGFSTRQAIDPNKSVLSGGRGLLLIRSFMDVVYHNVIGNEITMIRYVKRNPELQETSQPQSAMFHANSSSTANPVALIS